MLGDVRASVAVRVQKLSDPTILWSRAPSAALDLAEIAIRADPAGIDWAHADRYGGYGLDGNGGSGRSALYRGAYVKGIGRTPLIGRMADLEHSSGSAYFEEAVRETIYAEIFARELPWGAVRTSAIIDTGEDQYWGPAPGAEFQVLEERCVLLVREPLLRPAHFQRSIHFVSEEETTGEGDIKRVTHNLQVLSAHFGVSRIKQKFERFWSRWAEQCAYLFANRFIQLTPSTSNVTLDGRLVDFGAASAVPSWCSAVVVPGEAESGSDFSALTWFLQLFYLEHQDNVTIKGTEAWTQYAASLIGRCTQRYHLSLGIELLRLAGLRRATIEEWLAAPQNRQSLARAAETTSARYQRHFRQSIYEEDAFDFWDFPSFWDDRTPSNLQPLRVVADAVAIRARGEPVLARMRARCGSREAYFQETLRRRLHRQLPTARSGEALDAKPIDEIIRREVTLGRRDTNFEPVSDYLCGFAARGSQTFALFRQPDGKTYAIEESVRGVDGVAVSKERCPLPLQNGSIAGTSADVVHFL
jgi:hypothetical protein